MADEEIHELTQWAYSKTVIIYAALLKRARSTVPHKGKGESRKVVLGVSPDKDERGNEQSSQVNETSLERLKLMAMQQQTWLLDMKDEERWRKEGVEGLSLSTIERELAQDTQGRDFPSREVRRNRQAH